MPFLRSLVLLASLLEIAIGSWAAWRMVGLDEPDMVGMLLGVTVVIAGLASLSGLLIRPRPSVSRVSTVKLNATIVALIATGAVVIALVDHQLGLPVSRLRMVAIGTLLFAAPFLVNSIALGLIEHRMKRLA